VLVYMLANPEKTMSVDTMMAAGGNALSVPLVSYGGVIGMLFLMPAFTAFAVMVGLQWSIRSKGTIGSVVAAVMVLAVVTGVVGLCGLAGQAIPVVGAVVNAASPVNLIVATLMPDQLVRASLQEGVGSANVALLVGGGIAAVVYGFIVFGMHASMKRSFMMTVRRLAGTK